MITALDVANTFIERAKKDKVDVSPMKLQKLIYILYKEYLKNTSKKLFWENFEAWKYGPVIPSVYSVFKQYRANPIRNFYLNCDGQYNIVSFKNPDFKKIFENVWRKYKDLDAVSLSDLTHQENTAWSKAVTEKSFILKDDDIYSEKEYIIG